MRIAPLQRAQREATLQERALMEESMKRELAQLKELKAAAGSAEGGAEAESCANSARHTGGLPADDSSGLEVRGKTRLNHSSNVLATCTKSTP